MTYRGDILRRAISLTEGDRDNQYGPPKNNFTALRDLWISYLKYHNPYINLTIADVAAMMILVKLSRLSFNTRHEDNWIDAAAYAAIGAELAKGEQEEYDAPKQRNHLEGSAGLGSSGTDESLRDPEIATKTVLDQGRTIRNELFAIQHGTGDVRSRPAKHGGGTELYYPTGGSDGGSDGSNPNDLPSSERFPKSF